MYQTRRLLPLLILAASGLILSSGATPLWAGTGMVRLTWNDCDPITQNLDFTSPGQVATLIVSVTGSDHANSGHRVKVVVRNLGAGGFPDAWRFDRTGCQSGQLAISHSAASKSCPAYQGGHPFGIFQYGFNRATSTVLLDIANVYDAFTPLPSTRYVLWKATFDHGLSDNGAQDPTVACGFADTKLCFHIVSTETIDPALNSTVFGVESVSVTWNDASGFQPCPVGLQAEATTWGRVKSLYR